MSKTKRTRRRRATKPSYPGGWYREPPTGVAAGPAELPPRDPRLPDDRHEAAAAVVAAICLQYTPESIMRGDAVAKVAALWRDPLERAEAEAHVDVLVATLCPIGWAA